jgi:hypothetical protein
MRIRGVVHTNSFQLPMRYHSRLKTAWSRISLIHSRYEHVWSFIPMSRVMIRDWKFRAEWLRSPAFYSGFSDFVLNAWKVQRKESSPKAQEYTRRYYLFIYLQLNCQRFFRNLRLYSVEWKGYTWMMYWKGRRRKRLWPNWMYYPEIFVETEKKHENAQSG